MARTLIKTVIIGSGNVASQFARHLAPTSDLAQIYSPTVSNARRLADEVGCPSAVSSPSDVVNDADVYIVAVKDDAVAEVARTFAGYPGLWLHTSGTTPMSVFEGLRSDYGVIYPLQTLTRIKPLPMAEVPLFIEANTPANLDLVARLAALMGAVDVKLCSSLQRMKLHVAAVFACNYVNFMLMHAQHLLADCGTDLSAMRPLLEETFGKALANADLEAAQTGPARRGDATVISRHLSALEGESRDLYRFIANIINNHYNHHE